MNCPKCNKRHIRVINVGKGIDTIFRERYCDDCKTSFYTVESIYNDEIYARKMISLFRSKNKAFLG